MINSESTKKNLLLLLSKIIGNNYDKPIDIYNKDYIGFFQWDDSIDDTLTYHQKSSLAIDYFKDYFQNHFESIIIATSLIVDEKILEKRQLEYLLALRGFILPINYKLMFNEYDTSYKRDMDYDDIHHVYNAIISSFRFFSKYNHDDLINLNYVCMVSDILRSNSGYLFFIIPTLNLVIYPHDDIGFGCLCIQRNKSSKFGTNFIKGIERYSGRWLFKINN